MKTKQIMIKSRLAMLFSKKQTNPIEIPKKNTDAENATLNSGIINLVGIQN